MSITTLLFDVGGVVLTNAWDHEERARAAARFGLDRAEFDARHAPLAERLECGAIGFDEYLRQAVFYEPRKFTPAEFLAFVHSCSAPWPESLALLRDLAAFPGLRLATLNNEGRELNQYRIEHFGLRRYFRAFCTSCYLGARKPGAEIYRRALGILQADPAQCVFIDDREENLTVPRALGITCLCFESAAQLRQQLRTIGVATGN